MANFLQQMLLDLAFVNGQLLKYPNQGGLLNVT